MGKAVAGSPSNCCDRKSPGRVRNIGSSIWSACGTQIRFSDGCHTDRRTIYPGNFHQPNPGIIKPFFQISHPETRSSVDGLGGVEEEMLVTFCVTAPIERAI